MQRHQQQPGSHPVKPKGPVAYDCGKGEYSPRRGSVGNGMHFTRPDESGLATPGEEKGGQRFLTDPRFTHHVATCWRLCLNREGRNSTGSSTAKSLCCFYRFAFV
jgi:hypothetical protein